MSWLCLQQVGNVLSFAGRDRGLGELWNTGMVGVFVAFIRVVYGRMIYMSLPESINAIIASSGSSPVYNYDCKIVRH